MKAVPESREERELYENIVSGAQSSQGVNSVIQKRRKQNMLAPEDDQLVISDCGLSSLTQSIDATKRLKQAQGDGQLPLIAQSIAMQGLQATTSKNKKPPLDD